MQQYYSQHPRFYHAVDCIIFGFSGGDLNLLLLKRKFDPGKGEWSLMGGFVQEGEHMDDAAKRVLAELTGLTNVFMEQVGSFGQVGRDPGERVISTAYYALININEYDRSLVEEHNAYWVKINELPTLLFDHKQMVDRARLVMKVQAAMQPISFNLLPEHFTLTQLQTLYEAINGGPIDKRNFRKRVAEMDYIEKTELIDKITSRRGAALYKFNIAKYQDSLKFRL
ncbi:MAG: NUDIX hydrolase [Bacteroidaceae bacterium]|nr:NUDIX hydrolase [Bacteroidaceae bacterium]